MKKAYALSEKILDNINNYSEKYTSAEGKDINSAESIRALNEIVEEGFTLHRYMVEKKLYEGKPQITGALLEVQKYIEKLQINKQNAEKLSLSNALQIWQQVKLAIALFACSILDYRDSLETSEEE